MPEEQQFLLDTNAVSLILKGDPLLRRTYLLYPPWQMSISVITEAELHYGLCKKPEAIHSRKLGAAFLEQVRILPWTSAVASSYGSMRAEAERFGLTIGNLDLLIAAQARATGRILITNNSALLRLKPWMNV